MAFSEKTTNVKVEVTVPLIRRKRYLPSFMGKNKSKNHEGDAQLVHFSAHVLDDEGVVVKKG